MQMKLAIARRQLGTALELFIDDLDPVSVHCLACGGGELAHQLAKLNNKEPWIDIVLRTNPGTTLGHWLKIRNEFWNAMKHASTREGTLRDDEELLNRFDDIQNQYMLFIGLYDFSSAGGLMPLEAHIFMFWMVAMDPNLLDARNTDLAITDEAIPSALDYQLKAEQMFPDVQLQPRHKAKRKIRSVTARYRSSPNDLQVDRPFDFRRLTLGRRAHPLSADMGRFNEYQGEGRALH